MIRVILWVTLRQLLGQRRSILLLLLAALPIVVAIIFRVAADATDDPRQFAAEGLLGGVIVLVLAPLVALVFGTSALGQELEDGTAIFLLAKPVARWRILVAKVVAAWLCAAGLAVATVVSSGLIVLVGEPQGRLVPAFAVAVAVESLVYVALFVALSARFGRALILGAGYVFIWEAIVAEFAPGAQYLSVRESTLGIADAIADVAPALFDARLGLAESAVFLAAVLAAAVGYGIRTLNRLELAERSA